MSDTPELKFGETILQKVYLFEIWSLAQAVKTKAERVFEETKDLKGHSQRADPKVHALIASLLSDAANLKKLVVTPPHRIRDESPRMHKLRVSRAASLNRTIAAVPLPTLLDPKVRNTLEHFDEYLDEANLMLTDSKGGPAALAAFNLSLSSWSVFTDKIYPVRVYIVSERKFYNMKWSVDIGAMHEEASALLEHLGWLSDMKDLSAQGGFLVRLG